jgi:hypothetical protein
VVWWTVLVIVGFAVLIFLTAVLVLLSRLRDLRHVERALRRRAEEARTLEEPVRALQRKAEEMQVQVTGIERWLQARAARQAAESR